MKRYTIQIYLTKEEKQLIQIKAIEACKKDSEFVKSILFKNLNIKGVNTNEKK